MNEFLKYKLIALDSYTFTVENIVSILLIVLVTKLITFVIKRSIYKISKSKSVHKENVYTLIKIIIYFVWTVSIILILNSIGIKISALVTGSAALLVGVGLGLQQTFTDFISGIILLFEGKTKIGDILQIDNEVLRLENIGLRTTECVNRDGIVVFIPNYKIVTDKVINLTHKAKSIRFNINIGVSYDSDVSLVTQVLEESAKQHPHVKRTENIEVRMIDFGESSLLFQLLFFSEEIFRIESVKSDIRKIINQKFIENNIKIPYPQVDIHLDEHGRKIEK